MAVILLLLDAPLPRLLVTVGLNMMGGGDEILLYCTHLLGFIAKSRCYIEISLGGLKR